MNKWILTLPVLFVSLTSTAALQPMDGQETHGGNIVLSEFWSHHNYITSTLAQCPRAEGDTLASIWVTNIQKTEVKTAPKVFVGAKLDQEVVASNSPKANPPLILISESRWPQLNEIEKTKIVIHEALPVMGYLDTAYDYSTQLYSLFMDCVVPRETNTTLIRAIVSCEPSIERWGPAEMKALRPATAMSAATFHQCLPAILKLEKYGNRIGACNTDSIPSQQDSFLDSAIVGYYPGIARSEAVLDYILASKTSDLAADCDPHFATACKSIRAVMARYSVSPKLTALFQKLSCHK